MRQLAGAVRRILSDQDRPGRLEQPDLATPADGIAAVDASQTNTSFQAKVSSHTLRRIREVECARLGGVRLIPLPPTHCLVEQFFQVHVGERIKRHIVIYRNGPHPFPLYRFERDGVEPPIDPQGATSFTRSDSDLVGGSQFISPDAHRNPSLKSVVYCSAPQSSARSSKNSGFKKRTTDCTSSKRFLSVENEIYRHTSTSGGERREKVGRLTSANTLPRTSLTGTLCPSPEVHPRRERRT